MTEIFILHGTSATNILGWLGLIFGLLGTGIASVVAWLQALRNAKIVGVLSGLEFKRWSSQKNGIVTSRKIIPFVFLKNVGARNAVIEMLRLKFCFQDRNPIYAYPCSFNKTKSTEHFIGFALTPNETWKNRFPFSVRTDEYSELADRKGKVAIEVKFFKKKWEETELNDFSFHAVKNFLLPLESGCAAGSSFVWSDTVYSREHH